MYLKYMYSFIYTSLRAPCGTERNCTRNQCVSSYPTATPHHQCEHPASFDAEDHPTMELTAVDYACPQTENPAVNPASGCNFSRMLCLARTPAQQHKRAMGNHLVIARARWAVQHSLGSTI